ncbi:flavodoxin family protein [Candidatus Poriferisocius sp.]|uniref:flavodoxin family protein n=1 Tax=Candidatus Poriferisocius sp. TaxID=3101276 RepID=UPI003B5A0F75
MRAVVIFESRTGNTQRAAEMIGGEMHRAGVDAVVRPVQGLNLKEIAEADLLAVGTWVDGLVLFGHRPGGTARLMRLPSLHHKPVAAFATYKWHPGNCIDQIADLLAYKGADVVHRRAFNKQQLEAEVPAFTAAALDAVGVTV